MTARIIPTGVTLRSYQVGFGDCTLLTFHYGETEARHVLIDFGSSARPRNAPSLLDVAQHIHDVCCHRLHAIVATHRHSDHISGFAGEPGRILANLRPGLILQPWTEAPGAAPLPLEPSPVHGRKGFLAGLERMHEVAWSSLEEIAVLKAPKTIAAQLRFLSETNLKNQEALEALREMPCPHVYACCGKPSGLERILPGVRVHVLGPPSLKHSLAVRSRHTEDASEFWHFQAQAGARSAGDVPPIFPRAEKARRDALPFETRWFLPRLETARGEQLLEIVRILDKVLNNTSLILLFEVGSRKLLFPGDAQIESWRYALEGPEKEHFRSLLSGVDVYKVGHHGSQNATPRSLWKLFHKKGSLERPDRLCTLLSTMASKHGSQDRGTEVPRKKLVDELERQSNLLSTQRLTKKEPCNVVYVPV